MAEVTRGDAGWDRGDGSGMPRRGCGLIGRKTKNEIATMLEN